MGKGNESMSRSRNENMLRNRGKNKLRNKLSRMIRKFHLEDDLWGTELLVSHHDHVTVWKPHALLGDRKSRRRR